MSSEPLFPLGRFCWVDLATSEPDAATPFYCDLLGWEAEAEPIGSARPYIMLRKDGRDVAGLFRLATDMGPRPRWQSWLAVADVNASAARAQTLGGQVLMPPADRGQAGRMALVQDPGGAAVGLWQAREHGGARLTNAVGAFCWHELQTPAPQQAAAFYAGLLGWRARVSRSVPGGGYRIFTEHDRDLAGMISREDGWYRHRPGEAASDWRVYFGVADCDAAVAAVRTAGGTLLSEVTALAGIGRFAVLADPQGATFAVIEFAPGHD